MNDRTLYGVPIMADIKYCDTMNCLLNRGHNCTAHEVIFDENATCTTARYHDDVPSDPEIPQDSNELDGQGLDVNQDDTSDGWIKYV